MTWQIEHDTKLGMSETPGEPRRQEIDSRLGVRTMLSALDTLSVLECRTIAGVRLYALRPAPEP